MSKIKWQDVIDSFKLNVSSPIEEVNAFLWRNTIFEYFLFNDIVYKVSHPLQFDIDQNETELRSKDLVE